MDKTAFVIATTLSFGMGVNKINGRVVINTGVAYSGLGRLWMVGRGWRDDKKVICLTVRDEKGIEKLQSHDKVTKGNDLQFEITPDQLNKHIAMIEIWL